MITEEETILAEHETEHAGKPWVLLRKVGYQSGFGHLPGRMLFNVVGGPDTLAIGSTVTVESMIQLGFRVEVVE